MSKCTLIVSVLCLTSNAMTTLCHEQDGRYFEGALFERVSEEP